MKVYGAGLLSSAAELQYVMNGVEVSAVDISMLKHELLLDWPSPSFGVKDRCRVFS